MLDVVVLFWSLLCCCKQIKLISQQGFRQCSFTELTASQESTTVLNLNKPLGSASLSTGVNLSHNLFKIQKIQKCMNILYEVDTGITRPLSAHILLFCQHHFCIVQKYFTDTELYVINLIFMNVIRKIRALTIHTETDFLSMSLIPQRITSLDLTSYRFRPSKALQTFPSGCIRLDFQLHA